MPVSGEAILANLSAGMGGRGSNCRVTFRLSSFILLPLDWMPMRPLEYSVATSVFTISLSLMNCCTRLSLALTV
ncbi:hypothetical protein D3C75_871770 [compost metagenome]